MLAILEKRAKLVVLASNNAMRRFGCFYIGLAVLLLHGACSQRYDFRSDERPAFDKSVTPAELVSMQRAGATVLDVRLLEDFEADPVQVPYATYRDPDDIQAWTRQMSPADGPVIVYCVAGRWVSQKAANYLEERGFEVYSLKGGIEGWKQSGMETRHP